MYNINYKNAYYYVIGLQTGTVIGIRGADTAEFLSKLGYKGGEHFRTSA